jgi:hypothetical protein
MAKCHSCGAETELLYGGVSTCPKCAQALDRKEEAHTRKAASQEPASRTLAEVNRNMMAARDAYRKAQAARFKAEDMARHLSPGHPDGTQALHNANQQAASATERYERALREFIDYRPSAREAAS